MELDVIHPRQGLQEIICADCGHAYLIAQGQQSGVCAACGNIHFAGLEKTSAGSLDSLSRTIAERRVLPRLEKSPAPEPLAAFRAPVSGEAVEDLRIRFQVEWQLWAALVKNFRDPVYHTAYLCQAIAASELDKATERYRAHRSVMAVMDDARWQAEVADLMLTRIESISLARLEGQKGKWKWELPAWAYLAPYQGPVIKVAWVALGAVLGLRLYQIFS